MFQRDSNSHNLAPDSAAFAAAAAAAQAAASHQMSSAPHQHLSSAAAAAAAAAASSQFALPVPLPSDPAHSNFSAPLPTQSHIFDRSDQTHHNLTLSQSPPVFTSQHQSAHPRQQQHHQHHHNQQQKQQQHQLQQQQRQQQQHQQQPPPPHQQHHHHHHHHHQQQQHSQQQQQHHQQQHHPHLQPAKTHPHHQDLPSSSRRQSQSHQQHPHSQSRKGKRASTSAPIPSLPRPHHSASMSNPVDHSQQHTVTMVAQDAHTFTRIAAPPPVNVAQPADNRNGGSPLRNDSLYPHIPTRPTHPQHQSQQHQPVVTTVAAHPEQHIAIQPQSTPQQHPPGLRNVTTSFNAAQLSENRVQVATRLSFEEESRRRAGNTQTSSQQTPPVMLQFSDNYMTQQQDGINDNRQRVMNISETVTHQRDAQPRFDGDPSTLVTPGMAYDIKEGELDQKRIGANGATAPEGVLTSGGLDPTAINRQPSLITSRTPARLGPDGRPINPSVFIHGTVEKRVACENCGLLFGDVGSLKRHAARSHRVATGKGPVYCPQCNASLKNEQNLRRHIAVCHSGDQENRCDMCNASFSSRGSLRIHQQQVHNVPPGSKGARGGRGGRGGGRGGRVGGINKTTKSDKSYVCDMCTDTFKWKGNLKRHRELRHLHLRPFFCQICNASFGTKSNMRVHLITHNNAQNK